jgi:ATP-dependent Clp protease ATP-binding subunit ClpX
LRSIIEGVMLELMYDLPDQGRGCRYMVTKDVVEGRQSLMPIVEPKNKSA